MLTSAGTAAGLDLCLHLVRRDLGADVANRLAKQRVHRACSMLESTDTPLARVAERCGFGSELNLRHHFGRLVGVPPGEYGRTFRLNGPDLPTP